LAAGCDLGNYPGAVKGDELRVVDAFCAWLGKEGWTTEREVKFLDVLATRGDERLYAEAKGITTSPGLDIDTLYGQLLRRMPPDEIGEAIFAVVVPDTALKSAQRVPARVREVLRIRIYGVCQRRRHSIALCRQQVMTRRTGLASFGRGTI
jgi:hypothetical protein